MQKFTRREFTRIAGLATAGLGATGMHTDSVAAAGEQQGSPTPSSHPRSDGNLYSELLKTWCDGLLALQVMAIRNPALYGAVLCPACGYIHGRCADAVYPFLRMARTTGDSKYIHAALHVYEWTEQMVSQPDGSWINEVGLDPWKGITVFRAVALAEALHHHGSLLDARTQRRWTDRLARAAKFLDGYMTFEAANVNYPVTSAFAFTICGQVLGDSHYLDRGHAMAQTALEYFTPNGLLFGEGHPQEGVSPKGCRPVDLGYNVEESLPSLALYALHTNDKQVLDKVIEALRTHMEFMLPDGAWDNSWGNRSYKWTWWGSRTSDGCHPAFVLMARYEPRFLEVAWRNLQLMAKCTHNGLLYGGLHYFDHGDLPCVHHTFTHAKSLAIVLDQAGGAVQPAQNVSLPRDEAYGLKSYPEIGTRLAAIGEWRATVTESDWENAENPQCGPTSSYLQVRPCPGGRQPSGGALSLLYHRSLGPIMVGSMTKYQIIELPDQQAPRYPPDMTLTPRVECVAQDQIYSSLNDFEAALTSSTSPQQITISAQGKLQTMTHQSFPEGDVHYHLVYLLTEDKVEIIAHTDTAGPAPVQFILPVVSPHGETSQRVDPKTVRVIKSNGNLLVRTDAAQGFEVQVDQRIFSLVSGAECLPLAITMASGRETRVELRFEKS
jgi:hypothetical protein